MNENRKTNLQPGINLLATIEKIKQLLTTKEVLSKHISFNKDGKALCFAHDEKSPSLSINKVTGKYKCFGCGVTGDMFDAYEIMFKESTLESCLHICSEHSIEPVGSGDFDYKAYQQQQASKKSAIQSVTLQAEKCQTILLSSDGIAGYDYLKERGINDDTIKIFGLGFDDYMKAVTIPLHNAKGEILGLSKRFLNPVKSKYINPSNSDLYNKSFFLYGSHQAIQSRVFNKVKHCVLVEGYFCLWQLWQIGVKQVASPCGTSFTIEQMELLKKQVQHVKLFFDNDEAGRNGAEKAIIPLLENGFRVEIILIPDPFKDPDQFILELKKTKTDAEIQQLIFSDEYCQDAVLYQAKKLWKQANGQPHEQANALKQIVDLLFAITEPAIQNFYIEDVCSAICSQNKKLKQKDLQKSITDAIHEILLQAEPAKEIENNEAFPEWFTDEHKEDQFKKGYVSVDRIEKGKPVVGYFIVDNKNKQTELSNFIAKPLFHIYAGAESRYMLSIYNGYRTAVLDVPAKVIPSIDQFQGFTVSEGNFLIFGNKSQWLRIASELLQSFPRCIEINRLGWQQYGFFAYVDKIFIPGTGLKDLDNWGIIQHNEENFLVPASCEAYRQLQRTGEDPFESDRYLRYKKAEIDFSTWAMQMQNVYLQKGLVAIAYVVLTLFRDIIYSVDNNCPHLYCYGEPSSGKSKFAESITAIFFYKRNAFNLNSGTDFAFFHYMQSFPNCPAHLNEFDIEVIKADWFQALKAAYDGEGRERGKGGSKYRTEVMRVLSTLILTGQKLVTADDNSLVSRSLIEPFSIREKNEDQEKAYTKLKLWESEGLSGLLPDILQYRELFVQQYKNKFNEQLSYWRKHKSDVQQVNQRVLQNYCHLATCYNLLSQNISLPKPAETFTEYCYKQAVHWSHFIRSSDTLSEFWRTLEFFINGNQVHEGWDYTIETVMQVKIRVSRDKEEIKPFMHPTKVLFLRLNNVHKLFQTAYRSRTGKEAMSQDNLLHYFASRKYNLGAVKQKLFCRIVVNNEKANGSIETVKKEQRINSSCYAFLYDDLGLDLESFEGDEQPDQPQVEILPVKPQYVEELPFGQITNEMQN